MNPNEIPDDIDFRAYEHETEHAAKVRPARDFLTTMIADIGKPAAKEHLAFLPWGKTHKLFALREGEVTCWAGVNGHGKSEVTGMLAASLVAQGEKCCVASFEMKPHKSLNRMVRQFMNFGGEENDARGHSQLKDLYEQFAALCADNLWFYNQQGTVTPARVIAVTRYCFKELGIKHMFIDSLMKCVRGEDDYNGQKDLVDELCTLARDYNGHIHLVHHMRKSDKETDQPDKGGVKGSGSITDQVDNLMLVWRNKAKELNVQANKLVSEDEPDTIVWCRKQRNGTGWEGPIRLYFDQPTKQYTGAPGKAMDMCTWPHREYRRHLE
jgi:twinkle protein